MESPASTAAQSWELDALGRSEAADIVTMQKEDAPKVWLNGEPGT